jgi:hypothetical protein
MSLINDALKRARQSQVNPPPAGGPPLRPVEPRNNSSLAWLLPAIIIFLIVVACFFIGLAMANRTVTKIVNAPESDVSTSQPVEAVAAPAPQPVVPVEPAVAIEPPPPLKVQGIAFDPSKPWAIINGRTVFVGDTVEEFHVKAISKYTVTLAGTDGKEKTITLGE